MREIMHRDVRRHLLGFAAVAIALAVMESGCAPEESPGTPYSVRTISGRVSGAVAAGVTVSVGSRSAVTDANGDYTIVNVRDGTYTVTPSLAWYTFSPASRTVTVSGANVTGVDFTATAIPRTYTVAGRVYGAGAANVTVTLSAVSGTPASATATCDASGAFTFTGLSSGVFLLVPSSPGTIFAPAESLVTVTDRDVAGPYFVASSAASRSIAGTVSGAVQSGVKVTLSGPVNAEVNTDASGIYVFADLIDGDYELTAALDGYVFVPETIDVTLSGTNPVSTGNDFTATELSRTYAITGVISGDVVASVPVTLSGAASATATTDAEGRYEFTGLAGGSYVVTPSLAGFTFGPASANVTVSGANVYGTDFVATATCTITGTVVGALAPVAIDLTFLGEAAGTALTDAIGRFRFPCAGEGSYMLFPSLPGYTFDPESRTFTVSGGSSVTGLDFDATAIPETYAIVGEISGDEVAFVRLTLSAVVGSPASAVAWSGEDGVFAFTGLSDGIYLVTPERSGYVFEPWNSLVTVDGEDVSGPFFTSARAVNSVIAGRVSGPAIATVTLTLSGSVGATATASATGEYFFAGLADGQYTVTPFAPGYGFTPDSADVTVSGGDVTGVNFASWPGYRISGTVSGAGEARITMTLSGDETKTVTLGDAGTYTFPAVPAGSYVVTPSLGGYSFSPASLNVTLVDADAPGTDFVATLFCVISGYVAVNDPGFSGEVTVALSGAGTQTKPTIASFYDFVCASDGSYMVIPSLPGYSFSPGSRTLTVSGAPVAGQDFVGVPVP